MPPTRKRQERSIATQDRLIDATLESLIELGLARTSTTEICNRSELSRGAQQHHFPRKAELLAAATEAIYERLGDRFREVMSRVKAGGDEPWGPALTVLWEIYRSDEWGAWLELMNASRTDPALRAHLAATDTRFVELAEQTWREFFGDPGDTLTPVFTRFLFAMLDGLALHGMLHPESDRPEQVLALLRDRILPGLYSE